MKQLLNSHFCVYSSANRRCASLGWTLLLFFAALFATPGLKAQVVLTEGFEANCANPAHAFFEGCFPGWISTHGSPDNLSSFQGVSAFEGSKYAHAYVRYSFNCWNGPISSGIRGEGMAITHNFQAGVTYRLSFAYRTSGTVQTRQLILTNGLVNQTGSPNSCDEEEKVPPTPAGSQVIFSPPTSSGWQVHTVDFTPSANYSQLWFRGANDNPPVPNWEAFGRFFLDAVNLEILCNPYSGVAAYHFEDANGVEKTEFCFGEDVYLDGRASENETRYFIDAWRRPIGSTGSFGWVSSLGWTINQQVGVINLSDAFAAVGYTFEPGYQYQIKLAIANPPCIPWTEVLHEFTVVCCDEELSGSFRLDLLDAGNDFSLYVSNYQGYENMNATHEWIVISSPNPTSGPYTTVYTTTTTGSAPFVLYDQAQEGLYYTVIHHVTTLCAEACFGKQRYADNGERGGQLTDTEEEAACEYCGEFDCATWFRRCSAPTNVRASQTFNGIRISWDPVPGATGYEVRIIRNDPDCCDNGMLPSVIGWSTYSTQFNLNYGNGAYDCFSYQIAAICPRGSAWSEKQCFQYHRPGPGDQDQTGTAPTAPQGKVFPNPARDQVTVNFDSPFSGQVNLIDALGRVVGTQSAEEAITINFNLNELPNGLYWIVARSGAHNTTFKVMKQ